jgi:hypothetical protein
MNLEFFYQNAREEGPHGGRGLSKWCAAPGSAPRGSKMNVLNENIWVFLLNKLHTTVPNEGKYCPYFPLEAAIVISRPCRQKGLDVPLLLADFSWITVIHSVSINLNKPFIYIQTRAQRTNVSVFMLMPYCLLSITTVALYSITIVYFNCSLFNFPTRFRPFIIYL